MPPPPQMLDANDTAHRAFSSAEARATREARLAMGELPRTFARLMRIFGSAGPRALKLADVVRRIKARTGPCAGGGEGFSRA